MAKTIQLGSIEPTEALEGVLLADAGVRLVEIGEPLTREMIDLLSSLGFQSLVWADSDRDADKASRDARCRRVALADLGDEQALALDLHDEKDRLLIPAGTVIPTLQREILSRIGIQDVWVEAELDPAKEALIGKALLRLQKLKRDALSRRMAKVREAPAANGGLAENVDTKPDSPRERPGAGRRSAAVTTRVIPAPGSRASGGIGKTGRTPTGRPALTERLRPKDGPTTASERLVEVPEQAIPEARIIEGKDISQSNLDAEIDAGGGLDEQPSGEPLADSILTPEPLTLRPSARIREMVSIHEGVVRNAEQIFAQIRLKERVDAGLVGGLANGVVRGLINDQHLVLNLSGLLTSDHYLVSHSINTVLLSANIAAVLGFSTPQIFELAYGALLHDIGMARIRPEIVMKKAPLTADEALEIRRHPVIGLDILQTFSRMPKTAPLVVYQENERLDGTGYPRRRRRALIHTYAKIVMVASAYDAICSERPHRPARLPYHGMERILQEVNAQKFDTEVVRALLRVMGLFPVGSWVRLSDGSVARVVAPNQTTYTRPVVSVIVDAKGRELSTPHPIDLADQRNADLKVIEPLSVPLNLKADLRTVGF